MDSMPSTSSSSRIDENQLPTKFQQNLSLTATKFDDILSKAVDQYLVINPGQTKLENLLLSLSNVRADFWQSKYNDMKQQLEGFEEMLRAMHEDPAPVEFTPKDPTSQNSMEVLEFDDKCELSVARIDAKHLNSKKNDLKKNKIKKQLKNKPHMQLKTIAVNTAYDKKKSQDSQSSLSEVPPAPKVIIVNNGSYIYLTLQIEMKSKMEPIKMYELYCFCQETDSQWKKVDEIEALKVPEMCKLVNLKEGHTYNFAIRAVNVHKRGGPFTFEQISI